MNGAGSKSEVERGAFFFFLIVTFSNRMEYKGKTEGERGVFTENISKDFCREGYAKDGEEIGLRGGEELSWGRGCVRGGKSESEKIKVGSEGEGGVII